MPNKEPKSHAYDDLTTVNFDNRTNIKYQAIDEDAYWPADFLYLQQKKHYEYLNELNAGRKNGPKWTNDDYFTYYAARDLINIISGQLELTPPQRDRAENRFLGLNRGELGHRLDVIAYCLCAYIVETDGNTTKRRCHPNVAEEKKDEVFRRIAEALGLNDEQISKVYGKLRHQLDD